MASNSFGQFLKLTTFGESHGKAIGGILDGVPSGLALDLDAIQKELDRRKPGQSKITTDRKESDIVQFLSGIFEGKTTGAPIGFMIPNTDQRSKDYSEIENIYRPSHADYTYHKKYENYDYRGGGRASARETANWVVAGAIAKQIIDQESISINAWVHRVYDIEITKPYSQLDLNNIDNNIVRCPDDETAKRMITLIEKVKAEGDSIGGEIQCVISGMPVGIGNPIFEKLNANLGKAMLTINAVKGFEIGNGFASSKKKGSEENDQFYIDQNKNIATKTNHSGGIQGGISNGEDVVMKIAFKPTATILKDQQTVNKEGENTVLKSKGRHDPCVLPRAVPIVEAMAALVIADYLCAKY